MKEQPEDELPMRAAKFLWLTNFSFGNQPPSYHEEERRWNGRGRRCRACISDADAPATAATPDIAFSNRA
jgi:hypothetical protein